MAAIEQNFAGLYGVEELSEQLGVSKSHLVRAFRAATGTTPGQYLTAVRIEAAKALLSLRDDSLELVASMCGFSGANYFCKAFKKHTGMTPAAWRAAHAGRGGSLSALAAPRAQYVRVIPPLPSSSFLFTNARGNKKKKHAPGRAGGHALCQKQTKTRPCPRQSRGLCFASKANQTAPMPPAEPGAMLCAKSKPKRAHAPGRAGPCTASKQMKTRPGPPQVLRRAGALRCKTEG